MTAEVISITPETTGTTTATMPALGGLLTSALERDPVAEPVGFTTGKLTAVLKLADALSNNKVGEAGAKVTPAGAGRAAIVRPMGDTSVPWIALVMPRR